MVSSLLALMVLALANVVGFALIWADKRRARGGARRIRERTLWLAALGGGALGVWAAMYTVRHKTRHASFVFGVPSMAFAQVGAIVWLSFQ